MSTFIRGFSKFFFSFSAQPSAIPERTKNPVLFWFTSDEFMRRVAASSSTGYTFLVFRLMDNVSISQRAIYWTGSPSSSDYLKGSLQTRQIVDTTSLSNFSFEAKVFPLN